MKDVYYAQTPAEAILLVDYLEQRGIDSKATNLDPSDVFGGVPLDPSSMPTVWVVNDADAERAEKLIAEHADRMEEAKSADSDILEEPPAPPPDDD